MKILDVYAKGYAGATMGGTSFMVNAEFPKERFPRIEEIGHDGYIVNILIPNSNYDGTPRFSLVTKLIDQKDSSISLWGEEETFTDEETHQIQIWINENNIEQQALEIEQEINEITVKMDANYDKVMKLYNKTGITEDEQKTTILEIDQLNKEYDVLNKRYEELHGIL